jgi:hypothetical protein
MLNEFLLHSSDALKHYRSRERSEARNPVETGLESRLFNYFLYDEYGHATFLPRNRRMRTDRTADVKFAFHPRSPSPLPADKPPA